MSDNKYTASSSVPSDRTEKLLRDTESSQGSKASSSEASDTKSASEISELKLPSMKRLGPGISLAEKYPEGASSSKKLKEGRALRPCLLVVANMLPFSAVGRSNNSWSLEISSGGPVTSLLGKFHTYAFLSIFIYPLFTLEGILLYAPVSIHMLPHSLYMVFYIKK